MRGLRRKRNIGAATAELAQQFAQKVESSPTFDGVVTLPIASFTKRKGVPNYTGHSRRRFTISSPAASIGSNITSSLSRRIARLSSLPHRFRGIRNMWTQDNMTGRDTHSSL